MEAITATADNWTDWPVVQFAWGGCVTLFGIFETVIPGYEANIKYGPEHVGQGWQLLTENAPRIWNAVSAIFSS